jgi:NTP pyrophosphatase (non-canonical NTP hydrolase)
MELEFRGKVVATLRTMEIDQFEIHARNSLRIGTGERRFGLTEGVFSECGSVFSVFKKRSRGDLSEADFALQLREELGDCLWYIATLSGSLKISFVRIVRRAVFVATDIPVGSSIVTFGDIEGALRYYNKFAHLSERLIIARIGALAGQLFANLSRSRQMLLLGVTPSSRILSLLVGYLFTLAIVNGIKLESIAAENVKKRDNVFPAPAARIRTALFDDHNYPEEQLPRLLTFLFRERMHGDRRVAFMTVNGVRVGDNLTDNREEPDSYRFHDVFHLAYAAVLGWSPVTRALLKCKRKSKQNVDENQDGARAMLIEEAVSLLVFNHATRRNFFSSPGGVGYPLLNTIADLVRGWEVRECKMWEWEEAILQGCEVFQSLTKSMGGQVEMDLGNRKLTFSP